MSGNFRKIAATFSTCAIVLATTVIGGCSRNIMGTESERTVAYTVVSGDDVPEEFKKQIDESKADTMKLTYKDNEYLYIAEGFGTQETGGYSITVEQLYVQDKAIYFDARLIAPEADEKVSNQASYPYIIIKTELSEMPVVFQ